MQHQTPQFIDVEDKVVGPLTVKQALYIVGGIGLCIILYRFLPFFLFLIAALPVVAIAGALAFYRHNNQPLIQLVESGFKYLFKSRLYLWRHRKKADIKDDLDSVRVPTKEKPVSPSVGLGSSRLKNLSWDLEVKDDSN